MKNTKLMLILASVFVVIGLILFAVTIALNDWSVVNIPEGEIILNTHIINEEFDDIFVNTKIAHVTVARAESDECKVDCYDMEKLKHTATVKNGVLEITVVDERKWFEKFMSFGSPKIAIYLPEAEYNSLKVDSSTNDVNISGGFNFELVEVLLSTGDVNINGINSKKMDVIVTTGNVDISNTVCDGDIFVKISTGRTVLKNVNCRNLTSNGTTGDILLENVITSNEISLTRSTGDIELKACDAKTLDITATTGDVFGTLLTQKTFDADATTGKIEVPKNQSGGECKIRTSTGDIRITYVE